MTHLGDTNKMVSDTLRTDAEECEMFIVVSTFTPGDVQQAFHFARQLERELNAAQQRIKRLEEAGVWQPIETAPTDMTWVIGYDAKDGEVGTIIFDLTGDVDDEDVHYEWTDGMRTWNPTHWMPLPEPPEAKEAKP